MVSTGIGFDMKCRSQKSLVSFRVEMRIGYKVDKSARWHYWDDLEFHSESSAKAYIMKEAEYRSKRSLDFEYRVVRVTTILEVLR